MKVPLGVEVDQRSAAEVVCLHRGNLEKVLREEEGSELETRPFNYNHSSNNFSFTTHLSNPA